MPEFFRLCLCALLIASVASPQEAGFLDLSATALERRAHEPTSGSVASGVMVGLSHGTKPSPDTPLRAILRSLDSPSYRVGDRLICEIEVKNTGNQIFEFPWDPKITDVEPANQRPYEYDAAALSLSFFATGNQATALSPVMLYGIR